MSAKPKLAYTVQELAEAVGVSHDVISRAIRAGKLAARYPTSRPVIPVDEAKAWFDALPSDKARS